MRRVSANYIVPVSSPPLKNGIIECDDSGTIVTVIDTGFQFIWIRFSYKLSDHFGADYPAT